MSLDIRNDDYLVVGTKEYPIREAAFWSYGQAYPSAILNNATINCSTKRKATMSAGGKRTEPTTVESDLLCTSLYPYQPRTQAREELMTPMTLLVTYIPSDDGFYELKLEDLKR